MTALQASSDSKGNLTRDLASDVPLRHVHEGFGRSVALMMGINAYERGVPPLRTACADVEAIGALLEAEHGFTTRLLRDREVTGDRLRALLMDKLGDELGSPLSERDRLLVYFAGHGLSLPGERGPEGRLLLADADASDPGTFFAMNELRRLLNTLPCRHVLVVLDCCFAGTFRWADHLGDRAGDGPVYRETLERFVRYRAWQVLVSASGDQTALDATLGFHASATETSEAVHGLRAHRIETGVHSPFADALLRGLRGAADYTRDGLIVATELELFVRDAVERATHARQTPQLYKLEPHDRGEFVFQVPGAVLDLEPAPKLSVAACPYQGLQPFTASERERFFGRARAIAALVSQVKARPLTVVLGYSGTGKSSLLAAGLIPALRETPGWTVIEARPGAAPYEQLRDLIQVAGPAGLGAGDGLLKRITAWLEVHGADHLCLAIDQAEGLGLLAGAEQRTRVLRELAVALEAHGARFRVVLTLRSEFHSEFCESPLAALWHDAVFAVTAPAHHELREIIEGPARQCELLFEPISLVDELIEDVLKAPGGLPLLSLALRELYLRCAERNRDRSLTGDDYQRMEGLPGALGQRASALLRELIAEDTAFEATARRVFLRMVISDGPSWSRRRAHRDEMIYAVDAETDRAKRLLAAFQDARLVVLADDAWELAHDWLVRHWPTLAEWRTEFGSEAFALQFALAEAAQRWHRERRAANLWTGDRRLSSAVKEMRATSSWVNARERSFIKASLRRGSVRVVTVGAIVITVLAVWIFYNQEVVDYCRDYTRRWGEPVCVQRLTDREAHERAMSVKLVSRGLRGHVFHVELVYRGEDLANVNHHVFGFIPELPIRWKDKGERMPCQWDFAYDSVTDAVSSETGRDRWGRVVYRLNYLGGSRDHVKAEYLDENDDTAAIARGDAERVEFIRSTDGRDAEVHYTRSHGAPARREDGVSIVKIDEQPHLIKVSFFDGNGKPVKNRHGVAGRRGTFDARGNPVEIALLDEAGMPTRGSDGFAASRRRFDEQGNKTDVAFVDEAGMPTLAKGCIAGIHSTFDAQGREIERMMLDVAGKPTRLKGGGYAGYRSTFDTRGHETEVMYFDAAGKSTRNQDGYAGYRSTFDARGNEIEHAYLDEAGRPTRCKDGYASYRSTFDARGNETERAYFDEAGRPTQHRDGYAGYRSTFDARGNEIERAYFDETHRLARCRDGHASYRSTFDARDNEIERAYFDAAGRPTRHNDGHASYRSTFDDRNHQTERAYFDEAGKPARHKDGYASYRSTFDARDNETERVYFDAAGKPTRTGDGYAGYRATFDARDNETGRAYFDEAGQPTRHRAGYAGYRVILDARDTEIERTYLDEAGKPTRHQEGYATVRSTRDAHDHETQRTYLDELGRPTRNKDGVAGQRSTFDAYGNETDRVYIDEAGKTIRTRQGVAGYRSIFDAGGNEIERTDLDEVGKPLRRTKPATARR